MTNLNVQLGLQRSEAYGINDNCVVVGWFSTGGMGHAFAWDAKVGDGEVDDLGVLTGMTSSWARAINSSGQIVGTSGTRAFLWDGTMRDLGILPGATSSTAYDINDAGWIVGSSAPEGSTRAFLSNGSTMYDLSELADAGSVGWDFRVATSINNAGQIVGYGTHDGKQAAFLLTPVPEPASLLALLSGIGLMPLLKRRRA